MRAMNDFEFHSFHNISIDCNLINLKSLKSYVTLKLSNYSSDDILKKQNGFCSSQ